MKITICGSIAFYPEMESVRDQLQEQGHEVMLPPSKIADDTGNMIPVQEYYKKRKAETSDTGWIWDAKEIAMRKHFEKVAQSDAILVLNYEKNSIKDYIGANTLLEMGLAFYLQKKIFLLNPIPEISYKEEILGMKPSILQGDVTLIKN